ncbi:MAG TPA: hypothetical protein VMG10_06690, partial [Gemmataceae bacterium]|nr:hypothetical protein [Gemmataceae bacterium]
MASNYTAAAWDTNSNDQLTNAQVTASVYVSALMPTLQVVARGTDLGTSTASYYGLSVLGGE